MESREPSGAAPPSTQSATVKVTRCASCSTSSRPGSGRTESRCPSDSTRPSDSRKASSTVPQASTDTAPLDRIRRPSRPLTTKPAKGSSGISQTSVSMRASLPAHQVDVVHVGALPLAEDGDDDAESHGGLGSRHGHHEEDEDVSGHGAQLIGIGGESQVDGVEHQLDAHQDHDGVATHEHADRADGEEHGRHQWQERGHHDSFLRARMTAPTTSTTRSTEPASNWNR